jgi:hypothetical protein
MDMRGF